MTSADAPWSRLEEIDVAIEYCQGCQHLGLCPAHTQELRALADACDAEVQAKQSREVEQGPIPARLRQMTPGADRIEQVE